MAVITRAYSETDGAVAEASSVNRVIDDLYTLQNGNIQTDNLAGSAVAAANLADSAVISRVINNGSVTIDKANAGLILASEFFS